VLTIDCPWCGDRAETEFSYGGQAGITRPQDPGALDDAAWGNYLFMRSNPRGEHRELWQHAHGCRRWFIAIRDTVTYEFSGTYRIAPEQGRNGTNDNAE
jgi:sarcosine oxidase subunit delta